jgi:hypothetical protein
VLITPASSPCSESDARVRIFVIRNACYRPIIDIGKLERGDEVAATRIDRLARSTFDLFAIVKRIVDAGAHFRSLAEPWADTSTSTGRLMLAVLGGLADEPPRACPRHFRLSHTPKARFSKPPRFQAKIA